MARKIAERDELLCVYRETVTRHHRPEDWTPEQLAGWYLASTREAPRFARMAAAALLSLFTHPLIPEETTARAILAERLVREATAKRFRVVPRPSRARMGYRVRAWERRTGAHRRPSLWYVNRYDRNRSYGGPEEGGWWYDTGVLNRSRRCATRLQAQFTRNRWSQEDERENRGAPGLSSVNCHGVFDTWIERRPGASFPKVRPHYE